MGIESRKGPRARYVLLSFWQPNRRGNESVALAFRMRAPELRLNQSP